MSRFEYLVCAEIVGFLLKDHKIGPGISEGEKWHGRDCIFMCSRREH
jgi:hypothetical protein